MVRAKKSLVALQCLVQISQCDMYIPEAFLHHGHIDICGSRVRMRGPACQMEEIQCSLHIPD